MSFKRARYLIPPFGKIPPYARGGIVSFSFDDAPRSAWKVGGFILKRLGFKGTYFICPGLVGRYNDVLNECFMSWDEIMEAKAALFEIGSHTFSHVTLDGLAKIRFLGPQLRSALASLERRGLIEKKKCGFAYPKGKSNFLTRVLVRRYHGYARGIERKVNVWPYRRFNISAFPLYEIIRDQLNIRYLLNFAQVNNGWIVFYTHDVSRQPSRFGCTPDYLEDVLEAVCEMELRVMRIGEVIEMVSGERQFAGSKK